MGRYHQPATEIPNIGRKLSGNLATIDALKAELKPGETLICYGDRLMHQFAQQTETQAQLDDLRNQYSCGALVSLSFFAVPSEKVHIS